MRQQMIFHPQRMTGSGPSFLSPKRKDKAMKNGIDISKWQGTPDWDKLAAAHRAGRLDFVILRAGYGANTIDPTFAANYAAATARGIPLGAYWYAYWRQATPAQEAAAFVAAVQGKTLQYGIWYDVEYEKSITSLSKSARTDRVLQALAVLAASGRYCGLYASTDMINNRLEYDRLRAYDIWAAQYGSKCTCKLPYGLWQYSSTGSADGIAGNVDQDRAYKDYPAFVTGALATGKAAAVGNGDVLTGQTVSGGGSETDGQPSSTPTTPDTGEPRTTKTQRFGPVTRGDLRKLLDRADALGLYVLGTLDIGPSTEGDAAEMEALGASLGLDMQEV